jgi:hypothetical protein
MAFGGIVLDRLKRCLIDGAAVIEESLQNDLSRQLIAKTGTLAGFDTAFSEKVLRLNAGIALIPEHQRNADRFAQALTESSSLRGEFTLPPAGMHRQADNQETDALFTGEFPEMPRIRRWIPARVKLER